MIDVSGFLPMIKNALFDWLSLFVSPLKNLDMLWIIVPVWCVWLFSEFFQEKKGTSFGNAISNGATMLFVGVDWTRYVLRQLSSGSLKLGVESITLIVVAAIVLIYGLTIIFLGIKTKSIVRIIGRVRETTYFMVMFSPVIYGVEDLSFRIVAVILAFFPVFYIIVEIFDRLMPTPSTFDAEEDMALNKIPGNYGGQDTFGAGSLNLGGQFNSLQQQQPQQQWMGGYPNQPQNPRQRNGGFY